MIFEITPKPDDTVEHRGGGGGGGGQSSTTVHYSHEGRLN